MKKLFLVTTALLSGYANANADTVVRVASETGYVSLSIIYRDSTTGGVYVQSSLADGSAAIGVTGAYGETWASASATVITDPFVQVAIQGETIYRGESGSTIQGSAQLTYWFSVNALNGASI